MTRTKVTDPFEKEFQAPPKTYRPKLLAYASGVVNVRNGKSIFHLTIEYQRKPSIKGFWLEARTNFSTSFSLLGDSELIKDEASAWKKFALIARKYRLKIVYQNRQWKKK